MMGVAALLVLERIEDVAPAHLSIQVINEVDPGRDVVDIHKQILAPERLGEPIMQPTGRAD